MTQPTVFILGDGYVGSTLKARLKAAGLTNVFSDKDVKDFGPLRITQEKPLIDAAYIHYAMVEVFGTPDVVINTIGYTGSPNVDACESDADLLFFLNVEVPVALAKTFSQVPFIHVSSGCIFNDDVGGTTFSNAHKPNFFGSAYSKSKAQAESELTAISVMRTHPIIVHRIRIPFGATPGGKNMLTKVLKYDQLVDAPNSMTCIDEYADWVATQVCERFPESPTGEPNIHFVHAVNKGGITYREVLGFFDEICGVKRKVTYITPKELNNKVIAPRSNCVLSDGVLSDIRTAMYTTIKNYCEYATK